MEKEKAQKILEETQASLDKLLKEISIPPDKMKAISELINYDHITFRYMFFTALLAKCTDKRCNVFALQAKSNLKGAYDARSLCHKVIVPFEKNFLEGKIGNSNEPFLNKPARFETISASNPVRKGSDKKHLEKMCALLSWIQGAKKEDVYGAFVFTLGEINKRESNKLVDIEIKGDFLTSKKFSTIINSFLEASFEELSVVAVYGAFLRQIFGENVRIHPINEAGSSSREVGDIDVINNNKVIYAIEVKDKDFTEGDVKHAATKAIKKTCNRVIFAYGRHATSYPKNFSTIENNWHKKGVDLTFISIDNLVQTLISTLGEPEYKRILNDISKNLKIARSKDAAIKFFEDLLHASGYSVKKSKIEL